MANESLITEEMKKAIGVESEPIENDVEKGAIIKFAEAIGDPNPVFNDEKEARKTKYGGIIAPPTFYRSFKTARGAVVLDLPLTRRLDGGSDWEYFQPVRPGDKITTTVKIADIREREGRMGKMVFTVMETTYKNQFGEVTAIQRATGIMY